MTTQYPAPPPEAPRRRRRTIAIGGLGLLAGCAAGAIIAGSVSAGAATTNGTATTSTSSGSSSTNSSSSTDPDTGSRPVGAPPEGGPRPGRGGHALDLTGTVTAVGTNSVTIKTSTATVTYGVTSASDIDKNGEATLRDLAVGDAVRFDTTTANGATVIDKLHAGDEAKDRPTGNPPAPSSGG